MQVELSVVKIEQWEDHLADSLQKIHICADAHGNPIDFEITEGEIHDYQVAVQLMDLLEKGEYFIADKGYDSDTIRQKVKMIPVILRRINNDKPNPEFDPYFYKLRHLLENLFARLKYFRSITTSFSKN